MQRELKLKGYQMAAELRITPEWYSRLSRGKEPISHDIQLRLNDLVRRKKHGATSITGVGHEPPRATFRKNGPPPMVASRITPAPGAPSSRADCEVYFAELLDAAERSGNPNAFPVIHDRMKKQFPINDWEPVKGDL